LPALVLYGKAPSWLRSQVWQLVTKTAVQSQALQATLGTWKGATAAPDQGRFAGAIPWVVQELLPEAKGDREELCGKGCNCAGLCGAEQAGSICLLAPVGRAAPSQHGGVGGGREGTMEVCAEVGEGVSQSLPALLSGLWVQEERLA